jgi:thymidylate synthase (FAD)
MDVRAQEEIRKYAILIGEQIVANWVPLVWEAFLDYQRQDLHLSRIEYEILAALIGGYSERARAVAESSGLLHLGKEGKLVRNRERQELELKLRNLGLTIPW